MISLPSAVETLTFRGREFYVKRDDLLHPYLSGNKFRKLYTLYHTPVSRYSKIISYGGSQSNAMLSLAYICHSKGWEFEYYTKTPNSRVRESADGNFAQASALGMTTIALPHDAYERRIGELFFLADEKVAVIPQGGATAMAKEGIRLLADEIVQWQHDRHIEHLHVMTPSGTGTTAFYLAKALACECYTTPVVGSEAYLLKQMDALGTVPPNLHVISTQKTYHFAKLYPEFAAVYEELYQGGMEFDLLYAPKMWLALWEHMEQIEGTVLYIHSGGVSGNGTMRQRYYYKGWMS